MRYLSVFWVFLLLIASPAMSAVVTQDFEADAFPPDGWTLSGIYAIWSRTTYCSGFGTGSASLKADFYNTYYGRSQELTTANVYPSGGSDSLVFDHAYATYSAASGGEKDSLRIYYSTDGGGNWSHLITYIGGRTGPLNTGGYTTEEFVPTPAQWATKSVVLPTGANKLKFVAHSAFGNQLYIDNIRISYPSLLHDVGISAIISPSGAKPGGVQIIPQAKVKNNGTSSETFNVTCKILRADGPEVYNQGVAITDLLPESTRTLSFAGWTPDSGEYYYTQVWSELPGDLWTGNDTAMSRTSTYFSTNRVLVETFTSTSCVYCPDANDSLNQVYAAMMDSMAIIRTHVWWPTNNDSFYLKRMADTMENRARVVYYNISAVPDCRVDGIVTANLYTYRSEVLSRRSVGKPLEISLSGWYDAAGDSGVVTASITGTGRIPSSSKALRTLRYAIVEDSCWYTGTNGDPRHDQVLRDMVPDNNGIPIDVDKGLTVVDSQKFTIKTTGYQLPWIWTEDNCYLVAYVQDNSTKEILQSSICKLTSLIPSGVAGDANNIGVTIRPYLHPSWPNPSGKNAHIVYELPRGGAVVLNIYDVSGRLVRNLEAGFRNSGTNKVLWNLKDNRGRDVPNGVYIYRLSTGDCMLTGKLAVLK